MTVKTQHLPAETQAIAAAALIIRDGGLVAFPTETVYGLGADATSGRAVAGIYAAGDIRQSSVAQLAAVAGDGATAAVAAFRYLKARA